MAAQAYIPTSIANNIINKKLYLSSLFNFLIYLHNYWIKEAIEHM